MDPHHFGKLDPDPHQSEKLDPDPHAGALEEPWRAMVAHTGGLEAQIGAPEGL